MMPWCRWWIGTCADAKLGAVAVESAEEKSRVIAVWAAVLEAASYLDDGGKFKRPADEIAAAVSLPPSVVEKILSAMEGRLVKKGRVITWNKRQYKSDNKTALSKKYRAGKAQTSPKPEENAVLQEYCGSTDAVPCSTDAVCSEDRGQRTEDRGRKSPPVPKTEPPETSLKSPPALPTPKVAKRKTTLTPEDLMASGDAILDSLTPGLRAQAEVYLATAAEKNSTGKISAGRRLTLLSEIAKARGELNDDAALEYGLEAANSKGAVNINYAKKAAGSYNPWDGRQQAQRLLPQDDPVERQLSNPAGFIFSAEIEQHKPAWRAWTEAANNGTYEARVKVWSEAIRAAQKGDLSLLAAGPPEGPS